MYATIHAGNTGTSYRTPKQFTQQTAIALAKQFVFEVQATGLHVRHAILFGSFAQNQQNELSDIDLALVADEFEGIRFLDNRLIQDIKIKKPYFDIEIHTYNTAEFERGDNGFIDEEIKPKGIVIL
jgi:uncharacterized protein